MSSPTSQPVIADGNIICWESEFLCLCSASTGQRSAVNPHMQQSKFRRGIHTARCGLKTNENQNLPGLQKHSWYILREVLYNHSQSRY